MTKTTQESDNTVLITGAAGFIGFHLAMHYRRLGRKVIGADKCADFSGSRRDILIRKEMLTRHGVIMEECDLVQPEKADAIFVAHRPSLVFHFAALSSARCTDMDQMNANNVTAFVNVLAAADKHPPAHFLFSSSSVVYGEDSPRPFCEETALTTPDTPYASSKYAGEIAAWIWSQKAAFPVTIMRFFNVYGPWGRPDMAPFIFTHCLAQDQEVPIINGDTERSWLYIDDAISVFSQLAEMPPSRNRIVNVAGPNLVKTMDVLDTIARLMNKTPRIEYQGQFVPEITSNPANLDLLESLIGKKPQTTFDEGIKKFIDWYAREWLPIQ